MPFLIFKPGEPTEIHHEQFLPDEEVLALGVFVYNTRTGNWLTTKRSGNTCWIKILPDAVPAEIKAQALLLA